MMYVESVSCLAVGILMFLKADNLLLVCVFFKILQEEDVNGKIRTYEKKIGSLMTEVGTLKNEVGNAEIIILNS